MRNLKSKAKPLFTSWNDINWNSALSIVRKLQYKIFDQTLLNNKKRVHNLQKRLTSMSWARLLAVYEVTLLQKQNKIDQIDKNFVVSDDEKWKLFQVLRLNGKINKEGFNIRKTIPPKLLEKRKGLTNKRFLGLKHLKKESRLWQKPRRLWLAPSGKSSTVLDKKAVWASPTSAAIQILEENARQVLVKYALEPQWEAKFEAGSYGFRPGRSSHDAIEKVYKALRHGTFKSVFKTDLRKCLDTIDHKAFIEKLDTFPEMRNTIKKWLRIGLLKQSANCPKEFINSFGFDHVEGRVPGGILSPLLCNIALHGLEEDLKAFVSQINGAPYAGAGNRSREKRSALTVVRYADEFLLIHQNRDILNACIERVKLKLGTIGFSINEEASSIHDSREGFLFLGFRCVSVRRKDKRYRIKIYPSKQSQLLLQKQLKDIISTRKSISSWILIETIRPIIIGWANYFRFCECTQVFKKISYRIYQKLRPWVFRRDRKHGRTKVKEDYFPSGRTYRFEGKNHNHNWILVGKSTTKVFVTNRRFVRKTETRLCEAKEKLVVENFLPDISWVRRRKHIMVKQNASPFDKTKREYWRSRLQKNPTLPTYITTLLKKQNVKCSICKKDFSILDSFLWEVRDSLFSKALPKTFGGKKEFKNLQLVHKTCRS